MVTLKWIPLASIVGSIYQPRQQEDRELRRLAESIRLNGLLTSITVVTTAAAATGKGKAKPNKAKPNKAGAATYLMRSGHRRKKAMELLLKRGVTSVPPGHARIEGDQAFFQALVCDDVTAKEATIAALIDNLEREPLTPYEQACALRTLVEEKQIDRQDLARRAQIHPDTVDYMIAALDPKNLPLPMIKSWKQGRLDMGHVRALIRLRTYKKRQKQLYSKILKENLSVTEARFWCNRLLDKGDIPPGAPDQRVDGRSVLEEPAAQEADRRQAAQRAPLGPR